MTTTPYYGKLPTLQQEAVDIINQIHEGASTFISLTSDADVLADVQAVSNGLTLKKYLVSSKGTINPLYSL